MPPVQATKEDDAMRKWSRPTVVEIAVGMEINCYACAEI
ncbi:MAG: pyrroloquinoline quinone precursor peptide PqqA [Rhodospirillales bacterium]|nr:pyrroloquinoline quinone precursor peptide PqqA [Rhodospirillales bacterium]